MESRGKTLEHYVYSLSVTSTFLFTQLYLWYQRTNNGDDNYNENYHY